MDKHAVLNKPRAGQKYRPANGMEGEIFQCAYCNDCVKDAEFRETDEGGCDIWLLALFNDTDDPVYPTELQYGLDGQPTCTAFEEERKA